MYDTGASPSSEIHRHRAAHQAALIPGQTSAPSRAVDTHVLSGCYPASDHSRCNGGYAVTAEIFQVTSSIVINSGNSVFHVVNFGLYVNFAITVERRRPHAL